MALNIKNTEVERLAAEIARLTGETKTEAIKTALTERRQRLVHSNDPAARTDRAMRFLEREVWPVVPAGEVDRRLSAEEEEDAILGYGPDGR